MSTQRVFESIQAALGGEDPGSTSPAPPGTVGQGRGCLPQD